MLNTTNTTTPNTSNNNSFKTYRQLVSMINGLEDVNHLISNFSFDIDELSGEIKNFAEYESLLQAQADDLSNIGFEIDQAFDHGKINAADHKNLHFLFSLAR